MALTRATGGRSAVQTTTIDTETVDIPAFVMTDQSGTILGGPLTTSPLTQQRISFNTTGDQGVVGATAGQTTRVHGIRLYVAGATSVSIKNGATVLEVITFAAAGSIILDARTIPYWKTDINTAFNLASSAAVQVEGMLEYVKS